MDRETQVFRALANQNRRILLDHLLASDLSVGELSKLMNISQPAVSQHHKILAEAGLVSHFKEGRQNIYSVDAEPLILAADWLSKYEVFWDEKLAAFAKLLRLKEN